MLKRVRPGVGCVLLCMLMPGFAHGDERFDQADGQPQQSGERQDEAERDPSMPANPRGGVLRSIVDFRKTVRFATNRVFPSVVFIRCIREGMEYGRTESESVSGSGLIISASGEVVTNWHVVNKASEIRCQLHDGRAFEATLLGSDKDTDLALLQLEEVGDEALPTGLLGDSDVLVAGDFVMAMGAPWGLSRSVSIGIIATTHRFLDGNSEYSLWLQTDCAISPGNSGGPLVNTEGKVVGITSRGAMMGGDMGFAIPSRTVSLLVERIRKHGSANWSWFGLQLQPLRDFNRNMYFDGNEGVIIADTVPGGPGYKAGLRARDRILSFEGEPVAAVTEEDLPALRRRFGMTEKGKPAAILVQRGDVRREFTVTPTAKGEVEGEEFDCRRWNMTVKAINQFENPSLHFYRPEGVYVLGLSSPGNAIRAGLQTMDILVRIGEHEITTLDDVKQRYEALVEDAGATTQVILTVQRGSLRRQIVLDYSRDFHSK